MFRASRPSTGSRRVDRDPPVTRLTWAGVRPIVLYRVEGGGHGWPGAPQVPTARIFGRVPKRFDATGTILEFARRASGLDDLDGGARASDPGVTRLEWP